MQRIKLHFPVLLAFSLLAIILFAALSGKQETPAPYFPEKVNLALRRAAHRLLAQSGDSTSQIPPVIQGENPDAWIIRLERPFEYNALPGLLQESFDLHGITAEYDVMLLDCENDELLLGYNKRDFTEQNDPPCGNREQNGHCYNVQVTFAGAAAQSSSTRWLLWATLPGIFALGYFLYRNLKRQPGPGAPETPDEMVKQQAVSFGRSALDVSNQSLTVAGVRHELTYREAKLLQLFFRHPNQLLERDFILQNVWADEGILVGRSIDMFVSRLRKLLRADGSLRIATVHGVGYRLELAMSDER